MVTGKAWVQLFNMQVSTSITREQQQAEDDQSRVHVNLYAERTLRAEVWGTRLGTLILSP